MAHITDALHTHLWEVLLTSIHPCSFLPREAVKVKHWLTRTQLQCIICTTLRSEPYQYIFFWQQTSTTNDKCHTYIIFHKMYIITTWGNLTYIDGSAYTYSSAQITGNSTNGNIWDWFMSIYWCFDVVLQVLLWFVDVGLSCNEVKAVTSLHSVPDAWSSSPYAHDSRPEQGKTEVGADPAQCGWIGLSSLLRQERRQSLVERECQVPHSAWGGEDQGA